LGAELPYTAPFTSEKHDCRRATRGPWIVENGVASCKQDDALYKKYKDHGPVAWFDIDFTDATIQFAMKPDADVKSFLFTINGDNGHVFRFVTSTRLTLIKLPVNGPTSLSPSKAKTPSSKSVTTNRQSATPPSANPKASLASASHSKGWSLGNSPHSRRMRRTQRTQAGDRMFF
jgi:hypothetical protein